MADDDRRSTSCSSTTSPSKLLALEAVLDDLGQNDRDGARPGARRCALLLQRRVRRHPARRQHARHGRLRDGVADPPAPELASTRRSSSSPRSATRRTRPAAIRSAPSTTSSRRSSRRSCRRRSRSSSSSSERPSRSSSRRKPSSTTRHAAPPADPGLAGDQLRAVAGPDAPGRRGPPGTSSESTRPRPSAAPDQKWSTPRSAVSLSRQYARRRRAPGPPGSRGSAASRCSSTNGVLRLPGTANPGRRLGAAA